MKSTINCRGCLLIKKCLKNKAYGIAKELENVMEILSLDLSLMVLLKKKIFKTN